MAENFSVELINITKSFSAGFKANDEVNFCARKGSIHALVGENGAGKTTLMNILYGMYHPDSGTIKINGNEVKISSPADAIRLGIGMVHQHFMLVSTLSVLENIILGDEVCTSFGIIDKKRCRQKINHIIKSFGINVDLDALTGTLPVGIQQKIEILKILYRKAEILILDEPTAVLTPQETEELFKTLAELKNDGKTIILITHKLGEVLSISDSVTVLRRGRVTGELTTSNTDKAELARLIVGSELETSGSKENLPGDEVVLKVENVYAKNSRGSNALQAVSLAIRKGEILGIAGVEGNGQTELAEVICGLRGIASGKISIKGNIQNEIPIAHIPANRHKHGMVKEFSLAENVILGREQENKFSNKGILNFKSINSFTSELINSYDIRPNDNSALIGGLSGGNQQKVVAAREMTKETELIVISHPTRGLDIKAANFVHKTILEESKKGKAILLISSDLSELLKLSDKIAVMYNGKITAGLDPKLTNEHEIGEYMTGIKGN